MLHFDPRKGDFYDVELWRSGGVVLGFRFELVEADFVRFSEHGWIEGVGVLNLDVASEVDVSGRSKELFLRSAQS